MKFNKTLVSSKKTLFAGVVAPEASAESPESRCSVEPQKETQAAAESEELSQRAPPSEQPSLQDDLQHSVEDDDPDPASTGSNPPGITVDLTTLDGHQCEDEGCERDSPHSVTDTSAANLPELSQRPDSPGDSQGSEDESHKDPEAVQAADVGCIVVEENVSASSTAGSSEE